MKKEDQMIDALLKEHARQGSGDDAEFLDALDARLDEEEHVATTVKPERRERGYGMGVGIAAVLMVGTLGFYAWHMKRETDLAMNFEHRVEAPAITQSDGGFKKSDPAADAAVMPNELRLKSDQESLYSNPASLPGSVIEGNTADDPVPVPAVPAPEPPVIRESPVAKKPMPKAKPMSSPVPSARITGMRVPKKNKQERDRGRGVIGGAGRVPSDAHFGRHIMPLQDKKDIPAGNRYDVLTDNVFKSPWKDPLSTFSVDVDTASYTNVRRMIQSGQAVDKNAVRIEEMVNYFNYTYPQPKGEHPFSVSVETASCPWNETHRLVKVGLKGKEIAREKRPAANLVFLLDVSGSMNSQDKLPLLIDSMKILLKELNGDDSVSIVVYASSQGLALPPTHVNDEGRKTILKALENLHSGGSTNGGAGITLAYKMAKKHFVKGGINRVILGTDGDFNVGVIDNKSLVSMVEREAKGGVFLSVLGFGQGNLNDSMLEEITNKGNGNYAYIDNLRQGRKVFVDDMMGNMVTIAKDVKIQIEFNPSKVKQYRLIGYANRMLKAEDFRNKRIDAGEIGAGHNVTALYEVVPGNAAEQAPEVDDLEYQKRKPTPKPADREVVDSPNLLTVKLAYKQPDATKETESTYFRTPVIDGGKGWQQASEDFKFSSGVALFGMLLRQSEYAGQGNYALVRKLAEQGRGEDEKGHRTEFSDLVRKVGK